MTYALTTLDENTTYDLTFDDAMGLYVHGCRLWASENDGETYFEIFVP